MKRGENNLAFTIRRLISTLLQTLLQDGTKQEMQMGVSGAVKLVVVGVIDTVLEKRNSVIYSDLSLIFNKYKDI